MGDIRKDHASVLLAAAGAAALSGCMSLGASPRPVAPANTVIRNTTAYWDSAKVYAAYQAAPDPRGYRDEVIEGRLEGIDARYSQFKRALNRERGGLGLGVDLGVLAMNAAAAVSGAEAMNALAAGSSALIGLGGSVNKQLYYDRTLPALIARMEANRKTALARIRTGQTLDVAGYSLGSALGDLRAYEAASSLDVAIADVTQDANQAAQEAERELQDALFVADEIPADVHARKLALLAYVRELERTNQRDLLEQVAVKVGAASTRDELKDRTIRAVRNAVLRRLSQDVATAAAMNKVSADLQPLTQRTF